MRIGPVTDIVSTTIGVNQTHERLATLLEALRSNEKQNELDSYAILSYRRKLGAPGRLLEAKKRGDQTQQRPRIYV